MPRFLRLFGLCALLFALSPGFTGCTLRANREGIPPGAKAIVETVSDDIAAERYEKIYNEAAAEWRSSSSPEQTGSTFKTLKMKLGNAKSRSFHSATEQRETRGGTPGDAFVITYQTTFERGEGMETFTLVERDGRWLLARYFVNSDALK